MREYAVELARFACGYGRDIDDPVYVAITQGRQSVVKGYSSCGDLCQWIRWMLGVRRLVNRAHTPPTLGWRFTRAENIQYLVRKPIGQNPYAKLARPDDQLEPGDMIIIDDGDDRPPHHRTHACVVLSHTPSQLVSADYGQPGGKVRTRVMSVRNGYYWVGDRRLISWLPLEAELEGERAAGELASATQLKDWCENRQIRWPT